MTRSISRFLFFIPAISLMGYLALQFSETGGLTVNDWISLTDGKKCLGGLEKGDWHLAWFHLSRTVTIEGHLFATLFLATILGVRYYFSASKKQMLDAACEIDDLQCKANRLGNMGLSCRESGQIEKAIAYYEQALTISRKIGDPKVLASSLGNLGNAYQAMGNIKNAIGYHKQALAIFRKIGDYHGEGSVLGNLGKAHIACGQVGKAISYNKQSLSIFEKIGSPYAPQMRKWVAELESQVKPAGAQVKSPHTHRDGRRQSP